MGRRAIGATSVAMMVIVMGSAGPAEAKSPATYHTQETIKGVNVALENGFPNTGGRVEQLALLTIRIPVAGRTRVVRGVLANSATVTGHPSALQYAVKGHTVSYFCNGTIRTEYTGSFTLQDDGTFSVTINGRVISATGALKGTKARYRATGPADAIKGFTLSSSHAVTYPAGVLPASCAP